MNVGYLKTTLLSIKMAGTLPKTCFVCCYVFNDVNFHVNENSYILYKYCEKFQVMPKAFKFVFTDLLLGTQQWEKCGKRNVTPDLLGHD